MSSWAEFVRDAHSGPRAPVQSGRPRARRGTWPRGAGKVYLLVGERIREARVPAAQLVLMWVSANMPGLADRILASARTHYFGEPLTAACS